MKSEKFSDALIPEWMQIHREVPMPNWSGTFIPRSESFWRWLPIMALTKIYGITIWLFSWLPMRIRSVWPVKRWEPMREVSIFSPEMIFRCFIICFILTSNHWRMHWGSTALLRFPIIVPLERKRWCTTKMSVRKYRLYPISWSRVTMLRLSSGQ